MGNLNRRLTSLEAHRAAHRVGRDIDRRLPLDPDTLEAVLATLSDAELDELIRYLESEHPDLDVAAMSDAELEASILDLETQIVALMGDDDAPLVAT